MKHIENLWYGSTATDLTIAVLVAFAIIHETVCAFGAVL